MKPSSDPSNPSRLDFDLLHPPDPTSDAEANDFFAALQELEQKEPKHVDVHDDISLIPPLVEQDTTARSPSALSNSPDSWHENSLLLTHVGLVKLNDEGYINLDSVRTDSDFGYKPSRVPPAAWYRQSYYSTPAAVLSNPGKRRRIELKDDFRIHPIFHWNHWFEGELKEQEWEMLKPTWQLATLLLEEESMLGYWAGLCDIENHVRIHNPRAEARCGKQLFAFCAKNVPSLPEKQNVWETLARLAELVDWGIARDPDFADHAHTRPAHKDDVECGSGIGSTIDIHPLYFDILCKRVRASTFAAAVDQQWAGVDNDSAYLRCQFALANVMVHELNHALWYAIAGKETPEPFYKDTRVAELGSQCEQQYFSGVIDPLTSCKAAPFGQRIECWPGPGPSWDEHGEMELMSYKKWGRGSPWATEYALEMKWIQAFFTHDFWEEVDRYGLSTCRPIKDLGVRWDWEDGWAGLYEGESPTQRVFETSLSTKPPDSPPSEDNGQTGVRTVSKRSKPVAGISR